VLLHSDNPQAIQELLDKEFTVEDYYSVLNNLIQDEEDEKTPFYARILESIMRGTLREPHKIHFLKAIRQLTCSDIQLMRNVHIASPHRFQGLGNKKKQVQEHLNEAHPMRIISIQTLSRLGFVTRGGARYGEFEHHFPTELLDTFATTIFFAHELVPEAIDQKSLTSIKAAIVCHDLSAHRSDLEKLQEILYKARVESVIIHYSKLDQINIKLLYSLFIIVTDKTAWNDKDVECLRKMNEKEVYHIVVGSLDEGEAFFEPLGVKARARFTLINGETKDFASFKSCVDQYVDYIETGQNKERPIRS